MTDALRKFPAADNAKALVLMEEWAKHEVARENVSPKFNLTAHENASAVAGNDLLALRGEDCEAQKLCVDSAQIRGNL